MITAPGPGKFSVSISLNSLPGMAWGNSRVAKGEEVLEVEDVMSDYATPRKAFHLSVSSLIKRGK